MLIKRLVADAEERLQQNQVSITDFCQEVGVHTSTWRRWRNGEVSPQMRLWERVEAALDKYRKAG